MDDVIISIIVPIYNGEKYIDRVVNSILPHLNEKLELILVDDGSTDNSGSICDIYAGKHDGIRTVHKANGGVSSARNAGIAAARGEYLSFVDADDYMSEDAYSKFVEVIEAHHPDCVDFGWNYVNSCGEQIPNLHGLEKNQLLDRTVIEQLILPPMLNLCKDDAHFIYDFSWNKLFRADIIWQHQIHFDEGRRIWEDRPFVVHYLKYCQTFYSIDQCYYHYVDVPGSLSRRYSLQFFDIILENYRMYREWYGDCYNFEAQYVQNYWAHAIENMIFRSLEQTENTEQIRQNILRVLADQQVLHWFAQRAPTSSFEECATRLVLSRQQQAALKCYEKAYRADCLHNLLKNAIRKLKGCAYSLLRGY